MECHVTAYPQVRMLWKRNGVEIRSSWKYVVEVYNEGDNKISLSLRIRSLEETDYGTYTCSADNRLGKDKETMILYGECSGV